MNKNNLISIAGGFWCVVGLFLVVRGFGMYQLAGQEQHSTQVAIVISGVIAGLIGLVKGKFVFSKTARKNKNRIHALEDPVHIDYLHLYSVCGGVQVGPGLSHLQTGLNLDAHRIP